MRLKSRCEICNRTIRNSLDFLLSGCDWVVSEAKPLDSFSNICVGCSTEETTGHIEYDYKLTDPHKRCLDNLCEDPDYKCTDDCPAMGPLF